MFLRRCFSSKVFSCINFPALIMLVPSHLCGLLSFFISTLKKWCKRYFCNLQDDTDNKCFLNEAVFYLRWNIGPVELLNSYFVSAFFLSRRDCGRCLSPPSVLLPVWLLFELVTCSTVHRDQNTMVHRKALHPSPVSAQIGLRTILMERWRKKKKHFQLCCRLFLFRIRFSL